MVWYTSLIATPCLSTLSRSTLMYSSGTLGINVEVTKPISGRLRSAFALVPRFQRNEEETVVASVGEAEEVEADYRCRVLNSRRVCENSLYLFRSRACAFH